MTFPSPPQSQARQVRWHPQARYESRALHRFRAGEPGDESGEFRAPQGDQQRRLYSPERMSYEAVSWAMAQQSWKSSISSSRWRWRIT